MRHWNIYTFYKIKCIKYFLRFLSCNNHIKKEFSNSDTVVKVSWHWLPLHIPTPQSFLYIRTAWMQQQYKAKHKRMAFNSRAWLLSIGLLFCMLSISSGRLPQNSGRVKAVNLGGWLVTEGWIKPSLFDGIPNKDFLVN